MSKFLLLNIYYLYAWILRLANLSFIISIYVIDNIYFIIISKNVIILTFIKFLNYINIIISNIDFIIKYYL